MLFVLETEGSGPCVVESIVRVGGWLFFLSVQKVVQELAKD